VRAAAAIAIAILEAACVLTRPPLPLRRTCADGWPIKILQNKTCPDGICGYTCAPDRWREEGS